MALMTKKYAGIAISAYPGMYDDWVEKVTPFISAPSLLH